MTAFDSLSHCLPSCAVFWCLSGSRAEPAGYFSLAVQSDCEAEINNLFIRSLSLLLHYSFLVLGALLMHFSTYANEVMMSTQCNFLDSQ